MDKDMWTNLGSALEDFGRAEAVARGGRTNDGSFYQGLIEQRRKKAKDEAESTRQKAIDDYLNKKRGRELAEFEEMDNPESPLSQQMRTVAQQYAPDLDTSTMPASRMSQILPYLKDKYTTDKTNEARVAAQQAAIAREQKADEYRQMGIQDRREAQRLRQEDLLLKRQERQDRIEEKKQREIDELTVPGYGMALTKQDAKELKQAVEQYKDFKDKLDEMIELRETYGGELANRDAVARGQQLSKDLLLTYKNMAKLGVLSKSDEDIINAIIPDDPLAFRGPLETMQGQDSILHTLKKFKEDATKKIESGLAIRLKTRTGSGETKEETKIFRPGEIPEAD
jgi:hypothetical protein